MLPRLLARIAATAVVLSIAAVAAAEPPLPAMKDETEALATAARVTATKLRHRLDAVRRSDPRAAACIEPKMSEAMLLVSRIHHRRVELRDSSLAAEREGFRRSLLVLDARRADLEAEANTCAPIFRAVVGGMQVTMKVLQSVAALEPPMESEHGGHELVRVLMGR